MPELPMERLESMVGESHVSVEGFTVEAGKVEEFARALRNDDPAFRSERAARDRGFGAVPAPITFLRTSLFPRYGPGELGDTDPDPDRFTLGFDLGFDLRYRVHGEQEYELERPLYVGDTLTGTTTLADVSRREGSNGALTVAVLETEYADGDGAVVATERKTVLETPGSVGTGSTGRDGDGSTEHVDGDPTGERERRETGGTSPRSPGRSAGTSRFPVLAGDVAVGDTGPGVVETFDLKDFVRYAGASCGFDRIHYDRDFVREAGYPDAFAHGMLLAGVVEHMVTDWLGLSTIARLRTRFTEPLWPGDTLAVGGEVIETDETDGGATVEAELVASNQRGETVVEGDATANLPAARP